MRQPTTLLMVGLVSVAAGACTTVSSPGPPEYPTSVVASDGVPSPSPQVLTLHLPLDGYLPSVDEIYTVETATDLLQQRCMAAAGLDWPLIAHPTFGDWRNRRRYGVIESAVAHTFGYHAVPALLSPVVVYNEKVVRYNALSEAQRLAATTPGTGCETVATREIRNGITDTDDSFVNDMSGQSLDAAKNRPDVRQALNKWSACMSESGYHYPDPLAASADRRWAATTNASPTEITTAETDVQCQQRTDVIDIWFRGDSDIQQASIAANPTYFSKLAQAKSNLLAAARRIITGS